MVPLPNELVESILDHLYLDKDTLLSCALVARAWVPASQRGIFRTIVLRPPNALCARYDDTKTQSYLNSLTHLITFFHSKPRLATYVRSLILHDFDHRSKEVHISTAFIIQRLSAVNELSFDLVNWTLLSPPLKEALTNLVRAPSMTRLSLCKFSTREFSELGSLLSQAIYLKTLRVLESTPQSPICNITAPSPPRSIKLDDLLLQIESPESHHHPPPTRLTLSEWLQKEYCAFEIGCLKTLRIRHNRLDHPLIASMLQQTGGSLGELELQDTCQQTVAQPPNIVHLGYTPNLHTLKLVNLHQSDSYTPVPWIQSIFNPLLDGKWARLPLQHVVIKLSLEHDNEATTAQWDRWVAVDALFGKAEFAALRSVEITLAVRSRAIPGIARDSLSDKLKSLKDSGKLKVMVKMPGLTSTSLISMF